MLDLFCGLGGASQPFVDAGWEVVRVDFRDDLAATVVSDMREFTWNGRRPDLLWASPPCDEFARLRLKQWHRSQGFPFESLQLVAEVARIFAIARPRYFLLENVAGAIPYLGKPARRVGPFCLWGTFPHFLASMDTPKKHRRHGQGARKYGKLRRAIVPYQLGNCLRIAIENEMGIERDAPYLSAKDLSDSESPRPSELGNGLSYEEAGELPGQTFIPLEAARR